MKALLFITGGMIDKTVKEVSAAASIMSDEHYLFLYSESCGDKLKVKTPLLVKKGWCAERAGNPRVIEVKNTIKAIANNMNINYFFFDDSAYSFWVAPLLAGELKAAFISDVTEIRNEKGKIVLSKPLQEEKIIGDYALLNEQLVAIIRRGFPIKNVEEAVIEPEKLSLEGTGESTIECLGSLGERISRLEDAEIVIGLGDGVAQSGAIELGLELARLIQAEVAVTKPLVEKQVMPRERLVGLSGRRISPRVYLALGISGSMYHVSGVLSAGTIISVNKDEGALINTFSDYYYVGDLREVLPKLLEYLKSKSA